MSEGIGKAEPKIESAKEPVSSGADAVPAVDYSALRDDVAKLAQTVSDLVQKQAASTRDQMMDAVGSAANSISESATDAQEKLMSLEAEIGSSIRKNPWTAVAVAAFAGLLIAKLS